MAIRSPIVPPPHSRIRRTVQVALDEDLHFGDITSTLLFSESIRAKAQILAKERMVVAGLAVARHVFHEVDPSLKLTFHRKDGAIVSGTTPLLTITGKAHSLLQAERVALNFLQQLSGVSTLTHQFCQAVRGFPVTIVDTRKTTPGLRTLEKWAVRLGGGRNHRSSLYDGILIKDNHLTLLSANKVSLSQACLLARKQAPHGLRICVEVETLSQVRQALKGKADVLLLDNMTASQVQQAVKVIKGQALVEISGGITLKNIRDMAKAKPDVISIGALTHSAPAMDLSMNIVPLKSQLV